MNIILFGPPGVGKSTLIGILKTRGMRAIDLEDVYPSRVRFQLPNMVDGVILGGADLNPSRKYPNTVKVLITMIDQDQYGKRRAERDAKVKGKGEQAVHNLSQWEPNSDKWDLVLFTDNFTPEKTADILERRFRDG